MQNASQMQNHTVMVVDDDSDFRALMVIILGAEGFTVTEAEHGRQALDLLAIAPPHLIVLDLRMPVMDGRGFLQCKSDSKHAAIPVVIFSSTPPSGIEWMPCVEGVVDKFKGMDALLEAVRRVSVKLGQRAAVAEA